MEMKFIADSMLGKLAKWLRVLGYDTIYRTCYRPHAIDMFVNEGRILISRQRELAEKYGNSIILNENKTVKQMSELRQAIELAPEQSKWFCRCLVCNSLLQDADENDALGNVPDYVFHQNIKGIRLCPSCGRYYWPGSHKTRMIKQLQNWGF